ncbi:unnamed protein product [Moneuplotes crassus]|uniref:Uncharacterized protein n=1 Tax=Euplotes crassus TaxID=5936 RepID=A0AAD1U208_EUPCR|nr:unnamed protein product [Moneuplotes crassus]
MNLETQGIPFLILSIDTGVSDQNSKQNLYLYAGDDVTDKAHEFCETYNLSKEAVPIIVNHVKSVVGQYQKKIDQTKSTNKGQQSSMAQVDESTNSQAQSKGKKPGSYYKNLNSSPGTPSPNSCFNSSDLKPSRMPTIKEDLCESQQNSTAKKSKPKESSKNISNVWSPKLGSSSKCASMSQITSIKDHNSSRKTSKHSNKKSFITKIYKKTSKFMSNKSPKRLDRSRSGKLPSKKNTKHLKTFKKSFKTIQTSQPQKPKTKQRFQRPKKLVPLATLRNVVPQNDITSTSKVSCERSDEKKTRPLKKLRTKSINRYKKRNNSVTSIFKSTISPPTKFLVEEKTYRSLERDFTDQNLSRTRSHVGKLNYHSSASRERVKKRASKGHMPKNLKVIGTRKCTFKPKMSKLKRKIINSAREDSRSSKKSESESSASRKIFSKFKESSKERDKLKLMTKRILKNSPGIRTDMCSSKTTKSKGYIRKSLLMSKKAHQSSKERRKQKYGIAKPYYKPSNFRKKLSPARSSSKSHSKSRTNSVSKESIAHLKSIDNECKRIYEKSKARLNNPFRKDISILPHQGSKPSKIMEKIRAKRMKELLELLNGDKDDHISTENIISSSIMDREDKNQGLDYQQFYQKLTDFSKSLTASERDVLFSKIRSMS